MYIAESLKQPSWHTETHPLNNGITLLSLIFILDSSAEYICAHACLSSCPFAELSVLSLTLLQTHSVTYKTNKDNRKCTNAIESTIMIVLH